MKMFLKGGTCVEVSEEDYVCVITKVKVGFTLNEGVRQSKGWAKDAVTTFDDFIVPREYVERIEL